MITRVLVCCFVALTVFQAQADSHHPQAFLKAIRGANNEGEQIYNHFCVNCHAEHPVISLGAPKIADDHDWKIRLKQGMKVVFQHCDEGFNAMPARGGCFECSDEQLMLAIQFMLPKNSLPKKINKMN